MAYLSAIRLWPRRPNGEFTMELGSGRLIRILTVASSGVSMTSERQECVGERE
jgi:hypothetical protein